MRRLFSVPLGTYVPGGIMLKRWDPSGVIAAGINLAGNFATNQINAERASSDMATYLHLVGKQRDWQKEDQQWSEDLTKRLMDYQNQYNTPAQQMKRYAGAGLNPYLALQGGELGSGNSQSVPSVSYPSRGSVSPFQRPPLDNPLADASSKLLQGASVQNQKLAALASVFESLPKLHQAVGSDRFNGFVSSLVGGAIDSTRIERFNEAQARLEELNKEYREFEVEMQNLFGVEKARLVNLNLSAEYDKLQEELLNLGSEREVNDAQINELFSRSARNLAEKSNLEANTATVNKLRDALYFEARGRASSAYARGQIDTYDSMDRRSKFLSDNPERELNELVGTPDDQLSTSKKILKKAVQAERRLGRVAKNLSPFHP